MAQIRFEDSAPVYSAPRGARPADLIVGERWDVLGAMPANPSAIPDVGCGHGEGLQSYRQRGTCVVGVDIDPDAVQHASHGPDEAIVLDSEMQPWPAPVAHAFDAVVFVRDPERALDGLTHGLLRDFLDGSFTVAARPRASIGAAG